MALADDPETKLRAIQLYREQNGATFTEAKTTIEDYIAGRDWPFNPLKSFAPT